MVKNANCNDAMVLKESSEWQSSAPNKTFDSLSAWSDVFALPQHTHTNSHSTSYIKPYSKFIMKSLRLSRWSHGYHCNSVSDAHPICVFIVHSIRAAHKTSTQWFKFYFLSAVWCARADTYIALICILMFMLTHMHKFTIRSYCACACVVLCIEWLYV